MTFPKWKEILIACICAFGVLFALPNILPDSVIRNLPDFLPNKKVSLGLDLSGGSHLLLEVGLDVVENDYLNQTLNAARDTLRKEGVPYASNFPRSIAVDQHAVEFDLKDTSKVAKARTVLSQIDPDFKVIITGAHVVMKPTEEALKIRKASAVEKSIASVRKRVDDTGTREPNIQAQGDDRILLQIPGLQDPTRVKELLGRTGKLSFHLVDESAKEISDKKDAVAPIGSMYVESDHGGYIAVKKQAFVGGDTLTSARLGQDEYGNAAVSFSFNRIGAKKIAEITKANLHKKFAILLDNKAISVPVINGVITGGNGIISGNFTTETAQDLAVLLEAGALPAPLKVIEERTVGPDLGADSIHAGILATLISGLLVLVFMYLWYSSFGMIANIAVTVNIILLIAGLSCLQATLTLPGIAGIALTIGTAVDANVLINERIKEYIRKGEKFVKAVEKGYDLALTSIVDTNLNTIIGMAFLYYFGTGPVKGFAITTILGTVISFFTSTTLTRYIISTLLKMKYAVKIPM